jgi:hypothetical protein
MVHEAIDAAIVMAWFRYPNGEVKSDRYLARLQVGSPAFGLCSAARVKRAGLASLLLSALHFCQVPIHDQSDHLR